MPNSNKRLRPIRFDIVCYMNGGEGGGEVVATYAGNKKRDAKELRNWMNETYAPQGFIYFIYVVTSDGARVRIW